MEFTAKQIAELIQGRIEGDENATVNTFAKIEEGKKKELFLSFPIPNTPILFTTQSQPSY